MGSGKAVENPKPPQNHKSLGENGRAIGLLFGTGGRKHKKKNDGPGWKKHSSEPVEPTYAQPNQTNPKDAYGKSTRYLSSPKPGIASMHRKPPAPYTLRSDPSRWNWGFTLEGVSSVTKRPEPRRATRSKFARGNKENRWRLGGGWFTFFGWLWFGGGPLTKCLKGLTWVDLLFFSRFYLFIYVLSWGAPEQKGGYVFFLGQPSGLPHKTTTWTNYPSVPWNPPNPTPKRQAFSGSMLARVVVWPDHLWGPKSRCNLRGSVGLFLGPPFWLALKGDNKKATIVWAPEKQRHTQIWQRGPLIDALICDGVRTQQVSALAWQQFLQSLQAD